MKQVIYNRIFLILLFGGLFTSNLFAQKLYKLDVTENVIVDRCECGSGPLLTLHLQDGTTTTNYNQVFTEARKPIKATVIAITEQSRDDCRETGATDYNLNECQPVLTPATAIGCAVSSFSLILFSTPDPITTGLSSGGSNEDYCQNETINLATNTCITGTSDNLRWEVSKSPNSGYTFFKTSSTLTTTANFGEVASKLSGIAYGAPIYFKVRYTSNSDLNYSDVKLIRFNAPPPSFAAGQITPFDPACANDLGRIEITGTNSVPQANQFSYRLQFKNNMGQWVPSSTPNATQNNQNANTTPVIFSDLTPGTYRIELVTQNIPSCEPGYSGEIVIEQAPDLLEWDEPTCSNCNGPSGSRTTFQTKCVGSTAQIVFNKPTGGTPDYTYTVTASSSPSVSINTPQAVTGSTFSLNLPAGTHTVTITDANNCTPNPNSYTITVTDPPVITAMIDYPIKTSSNANVSCLGAKDGQIEVTPDGGIGPFMVTLKRGGAVVGTPVEVAKSNTVTFSSLEANINDYMVEVVTTIS